MLDSVLSYMLSHCLAAVAGSSGIYYFSEYGLYQIFLISLALFQMDEF